MLITSTLFVEAYSAEYADIGYRDGLLLESSIRIKSVIYVQAAKGELFQSAGVGIGFSKKNYSFMFSVNALETDIKDYSAELQINYYDVGRMSYFASVSQAQINGIGYRLGVGYALSEKISVITHYSNNGIFLGFRKWL